MASNVLAYVGVDNYDIILYLSRILTNLGKKVLLTDYSDTLSLKYSIPLPEGVDTDIDIIHYRDVDFTTSSISSDTVEMYDDILIAYGFSKSIADICICDQMIYVTNPYRYNQVRFKGIDYDKHINNATKKSLLLRDVSESIVDPYNVAKKIDRNLIEGCISVLFRDDKDEENALKYHNNKTYKFSKISKELKKYLYSQIVILHPNIKVSRIKKACCYAGRGR